jgi:ubiquinone/menaquinone biosynthesis C-methylase UbiE
MRSSSINKLKRFVKRHAYINKLARLVIRSRGNLTRDNDNLAAGRTLFGISDDETWLRLLLRSVNEPIIDGVEMPRFPHGKVQRAFVGSYDEMALREVFVFYQYIKNFMSQLGHSLSTRSAVLDFGSGWGRLTRIFWNDIDEDCLYGVDVDPEIVSLCKMLGVPGQFQTIEARGHLPYEDATFDLIISYSVFSHLPEVIASDWMRELSRVARPGAILAYTVQPKRFLSMILEIPEGTSSIWLKGLSRYKSLIPGLLQEFDKGMFCQLPTSGGTSLTDTVSDASTPARVVSKYRGEDVYADVAIPEAFIKLNWEKYFRLIRYLDDPERFPQAVVVCQKTMVKTH